MTEEKKEPFETLSCIGCKDVFMCPYLHKYQCPKLTIERNAGNE